MKWLRVDDLRYSQGSIGSQFQDGHTFEELIKGLDEWVIDPSIVDFLVLDAVEIIDAAEFFVVGNRRLHCLKEHQKHQRPWVVHVRCNRVQMPN